MWTNQSTFYEELRPLFVAHVKKHLRETVFHPSKILMRMDMVGGTLSMEGLEVLRMCETDGKKYVRNTIICCSADIKCCCAKVDALTRFVVPYEHGYLDDANGGGEYIEWSPQHLLSGIIKAYQLTEVAKERPVEMHVAIDGATLSKNWNHLTAGVKQGDSAAFCPRHHQLIYGNTDNATIQSRDHCFPFIIAMVQETKKSVDWMRPRLEKLDALANPGTVWCDEYMPLDIVMNTDMSFTWKYLGRGGAAKVKKYFCHCCTLKSDNIVVANNDQCSKWCDPEFPHVPCYHQTFANNMNMEYKHVHQQLGTILEQRM